MAALSVQSSGAGMTRWVRWPRRAWAASRSRRLRATPPPRAIGGAGYSAWAGSPRRIVPCPSDHRDAAVRLPADEVAVATRHDEPQHRGPELRLLELRGEDVGSQMADADHRQLAGPGDRLGQVDPDEQAADQARAARHRDSIHLLPAGARVLQRPLDDGDQGLEMRARRDLRHHTSIRRVQGILGTDDVRQQPRAADDDRGSGLVTRGLDRQDASVRQGYCGVVLSSPSISSVCRISLKRFLKLGAWIESDHITMASSLLSV